jgi:O-antigen/teichoic acid export membrane protein
MLEKKRFIMNFGWLMIAKVGQMTIQFLLGIFVARYLGPNDYGDINYTAAYVTVFTVIVLFGTNSVGVDEFVSSIDNREETGKKVGSLIFARFIIGIFSTLVVAGIVWGANHNSSKILFIAVLQSIALIFNCIDTINYWFQAKQELKCAAFVQLSAYAIFAVYKASILILKKNIYWFAFSNSVDAVALAVLYLIAYKKNQGPVLSIDFDYIKSHTKRSWHFIFAGIMTVLYTQTDKIMLGTMCNSEAVGLYSAVIVICNLWCIVINGILDVMRPEIMKESNAGNYQNYIRRITQTSSIIVYLNIFCAIIITIFAELVLMILYGKTYLPAAMTLRLAVWYTGFSNIGSVLHIFLVCERKEKYVEIFCFSGAVANILLNALLIPKWGITGAAMATLATQALVNVALPGIIEDTRNFFLIYIKSFGEVKNIKVFFELIRRKQHRKFKG